MAKLADAYVALDVDNKGLESGLEKAHTKTSAWASTFSGLLAGVGVGIAQMAIGAATSVISGVGSLIADSIGAASDLSETQSKVQQIFGDSSDAILAFGETAATTIGQTNQQALDGLATFGIYGKAAGLAGDDLVAFATQQAKLASDLASFNNTSPEEAIQAIGSALRGEAEPMRAYGVMLDDATLKQAAFDLGLTESAETQLTQGQKILAAQKAIFDQTQTQQGDFTRTSDGLANSQRTLGATWEDFKSSLGTVFLPVIETVMGVLKEFAENVLPTLKDTIQQKIVPAVQAFADKLGAFLRTYGPMIAEWVGNVIEWFGDLIGGTEDVEKDGGDAFGGFVDSIINLAVTTITAIGTILTALGDLVNWFLFNDGGELRGWAQVVLAVFGAIYDTVSLVIEVIATAVKAMSAVLRGDWAGALAALTPTSGGGNGMVPLLDANGNRIGWISEQQAAQNAGQVQQNRNVANTVNVNISTSSDPNQVGRDLNRAVQDALRAGGYS